MIASDDFKKAFYTMLLWKMSNEFIDGQTVNHAPWLAANYVNATDGKMCVQIKRDACKYPNFVDKTQGSRRFTTVESAFNELDEDANDWKTLDYVNLHLTHDYEYDDTCRRDTYKPVEIKPGVWVDSGRLYWFSLIPGIKFQLRRANKIVYFKWDDGHGALMALTGDFDKGKA